MKPLAELDARLNAMILEGQALEAFETYYSDQVVMQENAEAPRIGKTVNRDYEVAFFTSLEEVHGIELRSHAVGDDVSFSEWLFDVSFQGGQRVRLEQAVVRKWQDGQVTHERFYHP